MTQYLGPWFGVYALGNQNGGPGSYTDSDIQSHETDDSVPSRYSSPPLTPAIDLVQNFDNDDHLLRVLLRDLCRMCGTADWLNAHEAYNETIDLMNAEMLNGYGQQLQDLRSSPQKVLSKSELVLLDLCDTQLVTCRRLYKEALERVEHHRPPWRRRPNPTPICLVAVVAAVAAIAATYLRRV